jgi:hypothetical protein
MGLAGCGFRRCVYEVIPLIDATGISWRSWASVPKPSSKNLKLNKGLLEIQHIEVGWRCPRSTRCGCTPLQSPKTASSILQSDPTSAITCVTNPSIEVEDDKQEERVRHETWLLLWVHCMMIRHFDRSASTMQIQFKLWSALSEQFTREKVARVPPLIYTMLNAMQLK